VKRSLLFLVIGVLAVVAAIYALRLSQTTSNAAVTALLPRDTVAFAHVPDFNGTRDDWHRSDIYRLYSEPSVQEFLRKPLAQMPNKEALSQRAQQFAQLDPKDAFIAVTAIVNDRPKVLAGFRFRGSQDEAERIIAEWRAGLVGQSPKRETLDYQQRKIDIYTGFPATVAMAYDGHWFFAANDLEELKALLDRADGRVQDRQSLLAAEENFRAAMAEMPSKYALGFYLQPKFLAEKVAGIRQRTSPPDFQRQFGFAGDVIGQVRSICATTRFDNGKIHDLIWVGMPKMEQEAPLTRDSAALGTKDTFLYAASLLNISRQLAHIDPASAGALLGAGLNKIADALAQARISMEDWKAAFGSEVSALADWPANAHWPSGVAVFPVKEVARAKKIAGALAHASDHDAVWKEIDRNGVHYLSMQSAPGFLVLRPTIAITNRVMIVGLDPGSVEAAVQRSTGASSEFASSPAYRNAAQTIGPPENFFAYVDLGLLYSRLDATLRPILMMGAAFMPAVNEYVDLGKVPPAEVVAKHLSPIVSSQRYDHGGYITESVGPITLNHSGIALVALAVFGTRADGFSDTLGGLASPSLLAPPAVSPSPTSVPTP
jgi:hypothetical protein